jgi:YfiH family protein
LPHHFTDRRKGSSLGVYESFNLALHVGDDPAAVAANRAVLRDTQFMNQVHGDHIVIVDSVTTDVPTCDGLITTQPSISLAVMVADCIPLLLISKTAVGAVHVGRVGLVNRIAIKAVEMMHSLGATNIHAVLGPSICGSCYEVPEKMQQEVVAQHPRAYSTTRSSTPALDLSQGLIAQLTSLQLSYEASTICTLEDQMYFSHRRADPTGRFAGVVSL